MSGKVRSSRSADPVPAGFIWQLDHWLALGFGSGCARIAPGTFGSLVGVAVYAIGMSFLPTAAYLGCIVLMFALGIVCCGRTAADLDTDDHPAIVWDEVVGVLITLTSTPRGWYWVAAGFLLFRFFDIVKPWPIRQVDRHVHGGFGIMLDDAIAGLFGLAVLQLSGYLFSLPAVAGQAAITLTP